MEILINETEYVNGFNRGYWLFNYEPEVAKVLVQSSLNKQDSFSIGLLEGIGQAQHEKMLGDFEQLRSSNGHDQDLDIGK